jgi:hypothetical protein
VGWRRKKVGDVVTKAVEWGDGFLGHVRNIARMFGRGNIVGVYDRIRGKLCIH